MSGQIAILLGIVGIVVLFWLNRNGFVRTSKALWLPVIWIALLGSRPVSMWFGISPPSTPTANLDGSPVDAAVFGVLIAIGLVVLAVRRKQTRTYLTIITPLVLYS